MSIADQLIQAKADLDAVYAAGATEGQKLLSYPMSYGNLFARIEVPANTDVNIERTTAPTSLIDMFRLSKGFRNISLDLPTNTAYNVAGFSYSSATNGYGTIETIRFANGTKFSKFSNFACSNRKLVSVFGAIDLSQSSDNAGCFDGCAALVDVEFVAGTITSSISFGDSSELSDASIQSIIEGLNYEVSGQTLTVHPAVAARITETDVTDRGWALVY